MRCRGGTFIDEVLVLAGLLALAGSPLTLALVREHEIARQPLEGELASEPARA